MNIFELSKILLEYNNTNMLTSLTDISSSGNSGKSHDRITMGLTNPTQQNKKESSEMEKDYPNLTKLVNQMKKDSIKGNKIVIGAALKELQRLVQLKSLKLDQKGETILPFGKNVRLTKKGNNFFIKLAEDENTTQKQLTNLTKLSLPII